MTRVELAVNGQTRTATIDQRTSLRDCLHDVLGCTEVKQGCAEGVCGACVVLVDGQPRASCLELAVAVSRASGAAITTVTGLATGSLGDVHARLRAQLIARASFQCGYCAPGFVVEACHYLASGGRPDRDAVCRALAGHLCRCTGYHQIIDAVVAAAANEPPPAAPLVRPDVADKIDGTAIYPSDTVDPAAAIARIVWSAHAAARITAIDVSAALAVPGVERVLTWRDIPGANLGSENIFGDDQPLLAADRVRCAGDAVAIVIAASDAAARDGASQVSVTYEVLPAVFEIEEAIRPSAPQLGGHNNTIAQFVDERGDIAAAFEAAELIVEGRYRSGINDHMCMEPEGGLGRWDGDVLEITVPTHTPHAVRTGIARSLGLPEERIRVRTPRMGGAFGKYLVPGVDGLLALATYHAGRPVRLVLDRAEIIARRAKRHPFLGTYRLAMKRDGTFLGLDADVFTDAGPYLSITPTVVSVLIDEVCGAYAFGAVRARGRGVLTNNLPSSPMRGFGSQQINFGIESLVAKAAHVANLDPAALRRKNFDRTRHDGNGRREPQVPSPLDLTLDRTLARLGPRPVAAPGQRVGRGIATVKAKYGFPYGFVDRFVVQVGLDHSGEFYLASDLPDSGTGAVSGIGRLVANRLALARVPRAQILTAVIDDPSGTQVSTGHRPSRWRRAMFRALEQLQGIQASKAMALVVHLSARSERRVFEGFARPVNWLNAAINWIKARLFPFSIDSFLPRAGSSRATFMIGNAALEAADQLRGAILPAAARLLGAPVEQLTWTGDGVALRARSATRIGWNQLGAETSGRLVGLGRAQLPGGRLLDPRTGNQVGSIDHMFATHAVDLAIDCATGRVRVLGWVVAQDVGTLLDDAAVRGQIYGSLAMGLGQAIYEHLDQQGGMIANPALHDYLVPSILDMTAAPIVEIVESGQGIGPEGAKGVGEVSAVAASIAICHALYDALGVQFDLTTTPQQIIERLEMTRRGPGEEKTHDVGEPE